MQEAITYVGIDAHKKNLAIAMLVGHERTPTTWTVANEPRAVERLRRKLTRLAPGSCALGFSWTLDCERVLAGGVSR